MSDCTGAGIVIFFDNRGIKQPFVEGLDKEILYLFLEGLDGFYDFPKGSIDLKYNEDAYSCAIRETNEEINLNKNDFFLIDKEGIDFKSKAKKANGKQHVLRMFTAELKYDSLSKPNIKINPETKIKEHNSFYFLPMNKGKDKLLDYLKKPMIDCNNLVLNFLD